MQPATCDAWSEPLLPVRLSPPVPPPPVPFACPADKLPVFCNHSLPYATRARDLISKMSLNHKVNHVA